MLIAEMHGEFENCRKELQLADVGDLLQLSKKLLKKLDGRRKRVYRY